MEEKEPGFLTSNHRAVQLPPQAKYGQRLMPCGVLHLRGERGGGFATSPPSSTRSSVPPLNSGRGAFTFSPRSQIHTQGQTQGDCVSVSHRMLRTLLHLPSHVSVSQRNTFQAKTNTALFLFSGYIMRQGTIIPQIGHFSTEGHLHLQYFASVMAQ